MFNLSSSAKLALKKLHSNGFEAYVVGGALRNQLLRESVHDYDITTSASPDEIIDVFYGFDYFTTGIKHGTVSVVIDGNIIEITTFRSECGYADNRHPDDVNFISDVNEDLKRRDFTVNAICYDGEKVIDLFDGVSDCNKRILRCIGNPNERFNDDALRILRAIRFVSQYDFELDDATKMAIFARKRLLIGISVERIRDEYNKILTGKYASRALNEYREVVAEFLPEIIPMFDCSQKSPYHCYDVYTHTLKTLDDCPPRLELRLAMFLHDTGKPHHKTVDDNGIEHFKLHAKTSLKIANEILTRLKYSSAFKQYVLLLVEFHDYDIIPRNPVYAYSKYVKRALRKFGREALYDLIEVKRYDNSAKSEKGRMNIVDSDLAKQVLDEVLSQSPCFSLKDLAVDGNDLVKLGFKGKGIGEVLDELLSLVVDDEIDNNKLDLLNYVQTSYNIKSEEL